MPDKDEAAPGGQDNHQRQSEQDCSLTKTSLDTILDPLQRYCPSLDHVQELCKLLKDSTDDTRDLLRKKVEEAFLRAASSGDLEILSFLCLQKELTTGDDDRLNWRDVRDEEGTGPMNLAASSGHAEAVRLLVNSDIDVNERDAAGWTPLIWAVNCSNVPLASYLLSHGADADAQTLKGATCEDFILFADPDVASATSLTSADRDKGRGLQLSHNFDAQNADRRLIADLIMEHKLSAETPDNEDSLPPSFPSGDAVSESGVSVASSSHHSQTASMTPRRRLVGHLERTQRAEQELTLREMAEGRKRRLLDIAHMLEVDYQDLLGLQAKTKDNFRRSPGNGVSPILQVPMHAACGAFEVEDDPLSSDFDFDHIRPDQMLVFGETQIDVLVEYLTKSLRPVRAPWSARARPANVLFLCLRYTCHLNDRDLFEALLTAFVEAVEAEIYKHPTQSTHLAFWMYNSVLLKYYILRDRAFQGFDELGEYANIMTELIDEIYIFLIRDTERRIDKIFNAAILEHEAFEMPEDLRYEDEWNILRTLRGSVRAFGSANNSPHTSPAKNRNLAQVFSMEATSPTKEAATLSQISPRELTSLLESVLQVLQLYEINPAIIVQAFSQVFLWIGRELFNRILTQKRYLCKARAMHIRLNVSVIEDWIKTNALPLAAVRQHFAAAHQLVTWTLCQSSLSDFDGLISTMQGLKLLNPAQLRRVVRDYRYETNEPHMNAEGLQYLNQVQRDWERNQDFEERQRREQMLLEDMRVETETKEGLSDTAFHKNLEKGKGPEQTAEEEEGEGLPDDSTATARVQTPSAQHLLVRAAQESIDRLFSSEGSITEYIPPSLPSSAHDSDRERLNSRDMLPFRLPSSINDLIVSPGDAFGFGGGIFVGAGTPVHRMPAQMPAGAAMSPSLSRPISPTKYQQNSQGTRPEQLHAALSGITNGFERDSLSVTALDGRGLQPSLMLQPAPPSEAMSVSSSSLGAAMSTKSETRLFSQGKALSVDAAWQPVPLLAEETLEELNSIMQVPVGNAGTPTPSLPL